MIIEPMLIYWMSVSNTIKNVALLISALTLIASLVNFSENTYDDENKKLGYILLCISIFMCLIYIFAPSKEVLIKMQAFKLITIDNIKMTEDEIINFIDRVMNAVSNYKK